MKLNAVAALLFFVTSLRGDTSKYLIESRSKSPTGKYLIAWELSGHAEVDWSRLTWENDDEEEVRNLLGKQGVEQLVCSVYIANDMKLVQKIPSADFWPMGRRSNPPRIVWNHSEDAFFISTYGYWQYSGISLNVINKDVSNREFDLYALLRSLLDRHMKRSYPRAYLGSGYGYTFAASSVIWTSNDILRLILRLFTPKGVTNWEEELRIDLKLIKVGNRIVLRAGPLHQISLQRETYNFFKR